MHYNAESAKSVLFSKMFCLLENVSDVMKHTTKRAQMIYISSIWLLCNIL